MSAGGITAPFIIKPQTRMVQKVYDACDKILISSKGFEKSICEKGNYKDKIVYFPNWAESLKEVDNNFDIKTVVPFDKITKDDFVVLFAGNIGEAQNLDYVIEAANLLKDHKNIKFVFVCDGIRKEHLKQLVNDKQLGETVYFTGRYPLNTMSVFMKHADVLMFSLKDEYCFNLTVPDKVQFYMSQEKPIIAMINGDGAELIKEADCGIAVNANDVLSFYNAILDLCSMSKIELERFGRNGFVYYRDNFKKELRIRQLIKLLND